MDLMRLIIINQGTIAGVSGSPDGSNRSLECARPDSSPSSDNNSNRLQGRLSPASDNPIFLSDRESITPVPGQSILATQGFLLRKEEHTGQEEASSVPQLRVNIPFSETSESDDYFDAESGWGSDQQDFTPQIPLSSSIGNEHKQQGSNTVGHSRSREALPENSGSESAYSDAPTWGESDQPLLSAVGSQPMQPTFETVRKNGQEESGDVSLEALGSEPKPKKTGFFASITGMLGRVGKKNRGQEAKTHTSPKNTQEPTAGHSNLAQATKPSETSSSSPSTSHKPVKTGWTFNPINLVGEFAEEKLKKTAFKYAEDPRFQKALANAIRNLLINEVRTIDSLAEDVMPSFSSSSVRPKERGVFNSLYGEVKCHIKTRCNEALSECIQYGSGKILGNSEGSPISSFTPAVSFALQQKVENILIGNLRWLVTSPEGGEKIQLWLEGKLKDFIEKESREFRLNQPAGESDSELKKQIEELPDDLTRKIDEGLRSVSTAVKNSAGGNSLPLVRFLGAAVNEIMIKAVEDGTLKVESDFEGFANEVIGVLVHSIQDVHSDVVRMFSTKTAAEFRKVKDLREGLIQKVINATINEYCKAIGGGNFLRLAKKPVEWFVKSKLDALINKYSDEGEFKKEVDELLIKNVPDVIAAIKLSIQRAKWIAARLTLHEEIKAKYIDEGIEHHDEVAADDTQKLNRSQLLPTEIPAVSQGLVEAVKLGLGELQRQQPEIKARIQPHLTAVVDTAVKRAAAHGAVQVAGEEGAAAMRPGAFSAAAMPWCQGTATELLNQALTRGLATATAWVEQDQDGARAAITRALTPASGDSAEGTGQAAAAAGDDLSARILPHLRKAIDGTLDEALADILSQGVAPLRTAVQENRLLSTPAIRDALDQAVLQAVEEQMTRAGGQVNPLSDNVIEPVMATLASELTAGQATAVASVVTWLKSGDNARTLTGKITPALRPVVERVLADVLVDQLLPEGSEDGTESFKAAIQPYLHGLVEQFLDRAVNYSLERVVAWAEGHGDDITARVQPEIEKTLAGARKEVTGAIRVQQERLCQMAGQDRAKSLGVMALAQRVALNTEIRHGRKATGPTAPEAVTATGATAGGEQKPAWQRLLPTEIPAVSQGLVEAVKLGLGELQRQQPEIKARIQPHLTAVVDTAVKRAAAHGAVQVAGEEGAAAMRPGAFSAAAMPWCQGTATELLNQALTRGLATATAWVEQDQDGARAAITRALTPASGDSAEGTGQAAAAAGDDLSARILPHLRKAIDGTLDEALADILSQGVAPLRTAVQENRLLSTPAIRDALDQAVLQAVEEQMTRAGGQVNPLSDNVIEPVMATLASELTAGQATAVASVVTWLKSGDNARTLTGKITPALRPVVERVLADVLVDQLLPEGGEDGTESVKAAIQPYLHGLVEQFLDRSVSYSLERVVAWAEGHGDDITARVQPEIEKTLAGARKEVTGAIRVQQERLCQMAGQDRAKSLGVTALAQRVALNTEIRHGRKATGPAAPEAVTATGATAGGEQKPAWQRLLTAEVIGSLGDGLVAALREGVSVVRTKRQAMEDEIRSHLPPLVTAGVGAGTQHAGRQAAGDHTLDTAADGFSEAVEPWCQGLASGLLTEALSEGLNKVEAWLAEEATGARAAIIKGLTPTGGEEPGAPGLSGLILPKVLPEIREAIDGQLNQAMARVLRQGARQFQTTMGNNRLLSLPAVRSAVEQVAKQALQKGTGKLGSQLDHLSTEVLDPVKVALKAELVTFQTTAVTNLVDWLKADDYAGVRQLMAPLVTQLKQIVQPMLLTLLAEQLGDTVDREQLASQAGPYLDGLVQALLAPAIDDSLKRVVDWAEGDPQAIVDEIQPTVKETVDWAQSMLMDAVRNKQQQLQSFMAEDGEVTVVERARLLADGLAGTPEVVDESAEAPNGPELLTAGVIGSLGDGLVAALREGVSVVRTKRQAMEDEIRSHLPPLVTAGVGAGTQHAGRQAAGDHTLDTAADGFSEAVEPWCQGLASGLLTEALSEGLNKVEAWLAEEATGARAAIIKGLTPTGDDEPGAPGLSGLILPKVLPEIREAIDGQLNQAMARVLRQGARQFQTTMDNNRLLSLPAVRSAVEQVAKQALQEGTGKLGSQLDHLFTEVLDPVKVALKAELVTFQTTAVTNLVDWLKADDYAGAQRLMAPLVTQLKQVIQPMLLTLLAEQLGDTVDREQLASQAGPYLDGLVQALLAPVIDDSLKRVVDWAEGDPQAIVDEIQPTVKETVDWAQSMLMDAVRNKQQQLQSFMAEDGEVTVVERARLLADGLAGTPEVVDESAEAPNGPELLTAGVIGSLGDGLVAALREGVSVVRTKRQAMEDEIRSHLPPLVTAGVGAGTQHAGRQAAGDHTLDTAADGFSEAVEPWCQGLASGLLTEALSEGLNKVEAWLAEEATGARAAIIKGLTPTGGEEPGAPGLSGLILPKVLPEIREAIDGQLNQAMARVLRQGARQFQTTMDNNRLLSLPAVRSAVEQVAKQALQEGTGKLGSQLDHLSTEVLDPVKVALKAELVTFQTTAVTNLVDWLKADDYAGVRQLMAPLVTQLKQVIQPMLLTLLAEQLGDTVERDALEQLATPYLNGLVQALLAPVIDDSLKRVVDWAEGDPQAIVDEIQPTVKETVDWAQSMLMDAVRNKQQQLQSFMAEEGEVTVVERARLLADGLAGTPEVVDESAEAPNGPELLTAGVIGSLGDGLVAALREGVSVVRTKRQAMEDEIRSHLPPLVTAGVGAGTQHAGRQAAGDHTLDTAADGFSEAVEPWCQGLASGLLTEALSEGLNKVEAWLAEEATGARAAIIKGLTPTGGEEPGAPGLSGLILPKVLPEIREAIDGQLNQAMARVLRQGARQFQTTMDNNRLLSLPAVRSAVEQVAKQALQKGTGKLGSQLDHLSTEVLDPVKVALKAELVTFQTTAVTNLVDWLKADDYAGVRQLMAPLVTQLKQIVQPMLLTLLAEQLGDTVDREQLASQAGPYLDGLVQALLAPAIDDSLKRVVDWAEGDPQAIVDEIQPTVKETVDWAQSMLMDAVRNKQQQLQSFMAEDGEVTVVERARLLADGLAGTPEVVDESAEAPNGPELLTAGVIGSLGDGLVAALREGVSVVRTKRQAMEDEIRSHLPPLVTAGVGAGTQHAGRQAAGDHTLDTAADGFSEAVEPWCQGLASGLLTEALSEGLNKVEAWLAEEATGARAAIIKGLTPTGGEEPGAPGLSGLILPKVLPEIREAIDGQLNQAMARVLRQGARQFQTTMDNNRLLSLSAVRSAVEQVAKQALQEGTGKLGSQLDHLSTEVLDPVKVALKAELVTFQTTAVTNLVDWLKADDYAGAQRLMAPLVTQLKQVIQPMLLTLLAEQLGDTVDREQLASQAGPYLDGLVQALLAPVIDDSLKRVVDWAEGDPQAIVDEIQSTVEETVDWAQFMLMDAVRNKQQQLQSFMAEEGEVTVVERVRLLADGLAGTPEVVDESAEAPNGPELLTAGIIGSLGDGLVAALREGVSVVRTKRQAMEDEIRSHLPPLVTAGVGAGTQHAGRQAAGDHTLDTAADGFSEAVEPWCQGLASGLLTEALSEGLNKVEAWLAEEATGARAAIIKGLTPTGGEEPGAPGLSGLILPKVLPEIREAIDGQLNQAMARVLRQGARQFQTTMDNNRLLSLSAVRSAVEQVAKQALQEGTGKLGSQLDHLSTEVLDPVKVALKAELVTFQTTAVTNLVDWLKADDYAGAQRLMAPLVTQLKQVIQPMLLTLLAEQLGDTVDREQLASQAGPYLDGLVQALLAPVIDDSLKRVVDWAEGDPQAIVDEIQSTVEETVDWAQFMLMDAVRNKQQQLQSFMAEEGEVTVVERVRLLADGLAGTPEVVDESAEAPNGPELLTAGIIGSLGDGLVAALREGVSVVRTKRQAMEDEIRSHLPPLVTAGVGAGTQHAGRQAVGDHTLDTAADGFSEAVEPWCQGLASGLLTEALSEGLNKVEAWLAEEATGARAAIIKGLTPTGDDEPGAPGLSGLILPKILPEIREAIDGQLNQAMARVLRQGARQFQTTMDNNRLLSLPAVRSAVEQVAKQALQEGTGKLGSQLDHLFTEVLDPVKVALKAELVTFQTTAVTNLVDWLKAEDYAGAQRLMAPLVTQLKQVIQPMLLTLLAEQLDDTVDREQLASQAGPYLDGLVQALLAPVIDDSLKRVVDWAEGDPQAIVDEIQPTVKETVDWAQSMLMDAVRNKQQQLQSFMAEEGEVTVVERARLLADGLAGAPEVADEPAAASTGPELLTAEVIGSLSRGITAVISNGADIIRRKAWADNLRLKLGEDEHSSRMSILPMVKRHVQRIVNEAVSAGTEYGIRQLAEPSDGDPVGVTEAIKVHVQGLTAGYLSHMVADAIEGLADAVNKNAGDIQNSIETVLKNSGPPMDLAALLTPHINGAIDQALHQGRRFIQEGISKWIEANASEATPELHKAIDKILTHIMANGGKWVKDNQQGIEIGVLAPIQEEITATLKKAQADIIKNVALWLSDEANLNRLVSTFTNEIRTAVTNVVTATVAKQISGKDRGPEFERVINDIIPYVTPIVDQALTQGITYTVKCLSGWVQHHGADISSLVNPLIDKTVRDVMPSVRKAVQDKALLLAHAKAQDIDFNKLAAELAVAFVDRFDPDTLTSGALKVEPKSSVAKELPKVLCFLMQTAETYECLGGNLMEPVKIDRVEIDGRVFKDIKAQLIKMADGSIRIRKMDLKFEDIDKIDIDIEIAGISISYQLPEKSKLYRAALLSSAPMMSPADLARSLFDAFVPEHIDFNIDQITGEFHDVILDGPGEDTLGFGLSDIKLSLRLHQYYPKPYMDISVGPKDGHKTIESIKVKVAGQGVVDHIEADINVDRYRNGSADVRVLVEPGRLSRLAGWLLGGPVEIEAKPSINNAIGTLNDVESIRVRAPRFGGICNALVKNTIKAFNPDFSLGDDGKPVLKLKLALFSEERSNPITRWLAKAANRILQFFTKPIEVRMSFKGAPYVPPEKGEKGLGSFNGIRFIDGLFNPCPLSIQSDTHEELLRDLRAVSIDENPQGHLNQLGKIIDQVIEEFRLGNAPSDLSLVREIPLESLALLVNHVKENDGRQEDCARLLFLVANLVEALPEKAVQLVNSTGFTPEPGGQPYLLHLISATPTTCWLANPEDGKVMEPVYQSHRFKCLQEFWKNSQSNPDGSIYSPYSEKEPVQEFTEKAVEKVRTLVGEINIPDDIKLMMARDFDFAKMFGIGAPTKQDLVVSSPVNQPLFYSHGVPPVNRIKDMGWSKRRFDVPEGIELSGGSTAPVA